jgi:hypothetical protein
MYYIGKRAQDYDKNRRSDKKWTFENDTVHSILAGIEIKSAIDAPVGTGRFLGLLPDKTTGYDISQDMLNIAQKSGAKAKLILHDIINDDFPAMADLVLSIRFLNLINADIFPIALDRLLYGARKYAVFTLRTDKHIIKLGRVTVQDEQVALDTIDECGFNIVERYKYVDSVPGSYEIFLCKRAKTRKKRDNHIIDDNPEPDQPDRTVYPESIDTEPANLLVDGEEADTYRAHTGDSPTVPAELGSPPCNCGR